jgi:hypothetical protein
MKRASPSETLKQSIILLENQQNADFLVLKDNFQATVDQVRPVNLVRTLLSNKENSKGISDGLLGSSVGLTAGVLSKLLFQGATRSPIKKAIGTAIMMGVTNLVAKNPESIKRLGRGLFNIFRRKSHKIPVDSG